MPRALGLTLATLFILAVGQVAFVTPRPAVAQDKKSAATFEVYKDKAGEFRWRLRMTNTKVIATSGEGYASKRACEDAIESVKKNAPDAPVEEKESDAGAAKE